MSERAPNLNQTIAGFKAIPPERFWKKIGRTVTGIIFVGVGILAAREHWHPYAVYGFIGAGGLMASFEFITAPLVFAMALLKDLWRIVKGGNGRPPVPPA